MLQTNLEIDSKDIEALYEWYRNKALFVNRTYQRKLVWSIEEKRALISSVLHEYPIPLFLFVNLPSGREVLDGMQRLEALMSFIEQRYSYENKYFDLEATALTKELRDKKLIVQKEPKLSREESTAISRYKVAISSYSSDKAHIEEVFRRINSNGKTLSKQELRCAGNITNFSELVRKIAIEIRGDTSHSDNLLLNNMHRISIGSEGLRYGVNIENHFYITSSILTRKNFRASIDEELIAHMLGYLCLKEKPSAGSDSLDRFYGFSEGSESSSQRLEIENYIQINDKSEIIDNFRTTFETLSDLFTSSGLNFNKHILGENNTSHECPRYFQVIFLSFYQLLVDEGMEVSNRAGLLDKLKHIGEGEGSIIKLSSGSRWQASRRSESINDVVEHIRRFFTESKEKSVNTESVMLVDKLLTNSGTEQANYDFKQGFVSLSHEGKFNEALLASVVQTFVGINNISKDSIGYVIVGIADSKEDAQRHSEIRGSVPIPSDTGFHVVGVDEEAKKEFGSLDAYMMAIKDKIKKNFDMSEALKQQVLKDIKLVKYKDKHVLLFTIQSIGEVAYVDSKYYLRQGTSTEEVLAAEFPALFSNFHR
ncbi:DUF262 domain-containing protein [Vibrio ostreicida]|uniref:DUF262 domain-containing protein n=1 Tax=Vibrio ostreicida TaxID=526588 RepID=UPI00097111DD|nr:DUF262 domain-containing protein [Vibrio ostreicida]